MTVRILLVGDSTVTDDAGWGRGFAARLTEDTECVNLALRGRSSKSYRDEGHWEHALDIGGDWVFLQFGHNDQPGKGPERETCPGTTYAENLSSCVTEARAAGLRPILVTPLVRRWFRPGGGLDDTGLRPYVAAAARVSVAHGTPLLDLHAASSALVLRLGHDECGKLSYAEDDRTHLNEAGGLRFGELEA